jgi:hypothetical protein
MRGVFFGVLILALVAAVSFGVWSYEESRKPIQTVVLKGQNNDLFTVRMKPKEGEDIIIQCDEEDFQESFDRFRSFLGVKASPLNVPGGAMLFSVSPKDVPENLQPAKRAVIEVLKRHSPRRVVLIAHSDCLLYDVVAAWQNRAAEVERRQKSDLNHAREVIREWFPNTDLVEVYYARKHGDTLSFNPLPDFSVLKEVTDD